MTPDKWTREYDRGGIPSSVRETPSDSVVWAIDELKRFQFPFRTALDVGCGKGRNSMYLAGLGAHVTAMDFTPNAIEHLQAEAVKQKLIDKIRALTVDVTDPWPVAHDSMDLIVDAFCFKHITGVSARRGYREQMLRALRVRGHYLISFASTGDGYYGQYVTERSEDGTELLIADPVNGIESVLYTREKVMEFFGPDLILYRELHNAHPSVMHGQSYERSTYALLFQRNPHAF